MSNIQEYMKKYNAYRDELVNKILHCCENSKYCVIIDALERVKDIITDKRDTEWVYNHKEDEEK